MSNHNNLSELFNSQYAIHDEEPGNRDLFAVNHDLQGRNYGEYTSSPSNISPQHYSSDGAKLTQQEEREQAMSTATALISEIVHRRIKMASTHNCANPAVQLSEQVRDTMSVMTPSAQRLFTTMSQVRLPRLNCADRRTVDNSRCTITAIADVGSQYTTAALSSYVLLESEKASNQKKKGRKKASAGAVSKEKKVKKYSTERLKTAEESRRELITKKHAKKNLEVNTNAGAGVDWVNSQSASSEVMLGETALSASNTNLSQGVGTRRIATHDNDFANSSRESSVPPYFGHLVRKDSEPKLPATPADCASSGDESWKPSSPPWLKQAETKPKTPNSCPQTWSHKRP